MSAVAVAIRVAAASGCLNALSLRTLLPGRPATSAGADDERFRGFFEGP